MQEEIVRYNVRMPERVSKVFDAYAKALGYKRSTFIYVCAIDGLVRRAGRSEFFDRFLPSSGCLISEPSVDAEQTPE